MGIIYKFFSRLSPANIARLIWLVFPLGLSLHIYALVQLGDADTRESVSPRIAAAETATKTLIPLQDIGKFNLFGNANKQVTKVVDHKNLPKTTIKLSLMGVFSHKVDSKASALIADSSHKMKRYYMDDELPGEAVLKEIHKNFIVIERDSVLEALHFSGSSESPIQMSRQATIATKQNLQIKKTVLSDRQLRLEKIKKRLKNSM